jgi:hypothetical protein
MKRKFPKASPELAKSILQAQSRPSTRSVARALTASGYRAHWVTVARWRRNGWRTNTNEDHPLDVARGKLESIASLTTGDPILIAVEEVVGGEENCSDAALLRRESRKLSALSTQAWDAAERQLKKSGPKQNWRAGTVRPSVDRMRAGGCQCSCASRAY